MSPTIHIGFPKTGTTALQRHVFPGLAGVAYLGPNSAGPFPALAKDLYRSAGSVYAPGALEDCVARVRSSEPRLLLSHEGFGRHHRDGETAERLHRLLPEASVVAVVRNQLDLLRSLYHMYLRRGGVHGLAHWAEHHLDPRWIHYDAAVASYQHTFGADRVHVLVYEDMASEPDRFVAAFLAIVGAGPSESRTVRLPRTNETPAWPTCQAIRVINRLSKPSQCNPHPIAPRLPTDTLIRAARRVDPILSGRTARPAARRHAKILDRLAKDVAESNRRLAALTGLDLGGYGYPV